MSVMASRAEAGACSEHCCVAEQAVQSPSGVGILVSLRRFRDESSVGEPFAGHAVHEKAVEPGGA
jgi:hypothetical protein